MKYIHVFTLLTLILFGNACSGPDKKGLPKENVEHPKLIKTIGNPNYGNVQCSLQDKAGNLWFGTTQNGLYKYDGKSLPAGKAGFSRFLMDDGLISNNISCLLEDKDGNIWIGTDAGLCIYDPSAYFDTSTNAQYSAHAQRKSLGTGGKTFVHIRIPLPKNLPPNKHKNTHDVFSMMQAKSGEIWFATIDGVYIYDPSTELNADGKSLPTEQASFTRFIIDEGAMGYMSSNNNAERILEDKAGNIWFGGRGTEGVYRYNPAASISAGGKSVTNIKLKELFQNGPKPKAHNWAWPQLQDKKGNIWFSNWGGVYRYDGKSFTSFTKSDGLAGGVTRMIEDKKGNLWLGGDAGAGLSRYDGKTFTRFTTKDGLLNYSIWSILEDKTGNIWVGTRETGLYLYDGESFITYSEYKHEPVTD